MIDSHNHDYTNKFFTNLDDLVDFFTFNTSSYTNFCQPIIAVAVSGGSDSIALLILMHKWLQLQASKQRKVDLFVLTVNHHLRPESDTEVKYVENLCNLLQIKCIILDWDHQNNTSNLQARAREGRYNLMTAICNKLNIRYLAIAHHKDDYIENFYLRQERKSGILGLSSSNINFINNIKIIRPLFNFYKSELVSYLQQNNIKWFEDQSNFSDKYKRNKIRFSIADFNDNQKEELLNHINDINIQAKKIKNLLIESIAESTAIYPCGIAIIDFTNCQKYATEVQLYLIGIILTIISGNEQMPRGRCINLLIINIAKTLSKANTNRNTTFTLHNCKIIISSSSQILIYKELGKTPPYPIKLKKNNIWDNRFVIQYKEEIETTDLKKAYITHFTNTDYNLIKNELNVENITDIIGDVFKSEIKNILFTMPVIKTLEKIISLPHISYYNDIVCNKFNISFQPRFISRFIHFC